MVSYNPLSTSALLTSMYMGTGTTLNPSTWKNVPDATSPLSINGARPSSFAQVLAALYEQSIAFPGNTETPSNGGSSATVDSSLWLWIIDALASGWSLQSGAPIPANDLSVGQAFGQTPTSFPTYTRTSPTYLNAVDDTSGNPTGNPVDFQTTQSIAQALQHAGEKYGLPSQLLPALATTESGMNPDAVSSAGALGLMQLMPATANALGVQNPLDPLQSIEGAARYMHQLLQQFGQLPLAVAAYNAGPGAVRAYGGIPPFKETQAYVQTVMQRMGAGKGVTPL